VALLDQTKKGCLGILGKKLKMKWGDMQNTVSGDLTAMVWKDEQSANMLTNMHHFPAEGNICDEHGNAMKPATVQHYNRYMRYMDKSGCMIQQTNVEMDEKLFFHHWDLSVLNSLILLASCGSKLSH
jgi:hypothetical protein